MDGFKVMCLHNIDIKLASKNPGYLLGSKDISFGVIGEPAGGPQLRIKIICLNR